jgi:TPR repeat protein
VKLVSEGSPWLRFARRLPLSSACVALFALGSWWFQEGGFLDQESLHFLQHYLAERKLIPKLLDVQITDWGWYQGRELSYFVDWLDAEFILASLRAGFVHFYPLSHVLACAAIVAVHEHYGRRHFRATGPATRALLAGLFVSSSHAVFATYYRSAKDLVAVALYALSWLVFAPPPQAERANAACVARAAQRRRAVASFTLALVMANGDRQGFYLLALLISIRLLLSLLERSRAALPIAGLLVAALAASELINRVLTPALIGSVIGRAPSTAHQDLGFLAEPLAALIRGEGWARVLESAALVPALASHMFGSFGTTAGAVALIALGALLARANPSSTAVTAALARAEAARYGIAFAVAVTGVGVLAFAMAQKESFVTQPESAILYYFAPANALLFLAVSGAAERLLARSATSERWIQLGLCALIVANLLALPRLRAIALAPESSWTGHERAAELRRCLRSRDVDAQGYALHPREAALCRFLLRRVDPRFDEPARDPIADRRLGLAYLAGGDLLVDAGEAIAWLTRAARSGDAVAARELGRADFSRFASVGSLAKLPSASERLAWLARAAEQRDLAAQCSLAVAYHEGLGAPAEFERARSEAQRCVELARELGIPERRVFRTQPRASDRRILRSLLAGVLGSSPSAR